MVLKVRAVATITSNTEKNVVKVKIIEAQKQRPQHGDDNAGHDGLYYGDVEARQELKLANTRLEPRTGT